MGFKFYDLASKPAPFDIVWAKWPLRGDKLLPGPSVRPVLVIDVRDWEDTRTGEVFAAVTAQYGGSYDLKDIPQNLLITNRECRVLGLHKSTLFRLDLGNRKRLPWAQEYFVSQGYVRSQNLIAGRLNSDQQQRMLLAMKERGLAFPVP